MIQERVAPLDGRAAQQAALLAAQRKTQERSVDLGDTLIAGIAMAHEAQLATRNLRHFIDTIISHLSLIGWCSDALMLGYLYQRDCFNTWSHANNARY